MLIVSLFSLCRLRITTQHISGTADKMAGICTKRIWQRYSLHLCAAFPVGYLSKTAALCMLVPFASTNHCELRFSTLVYIKLKLLENTITNHQKYVINYTMSRKMLQQQTAH